MKDQQVLVVAGGCFWCVEAIFEMLEGVSLVESGYTGGTTKNPNYKDVSFGDSGHAEAVRITYDPKAVSEEDLLRIFFTTHDPTQLNRQGNDVGTMYRSAVFYRDDAQRKTAEKIIEEIERAKIWKGAIVTTLEPLGDFSIAEEYHQDYFDQFLKADPEKRSTMNAGYCQVIIEPKVRKFREKYASKLKKSIKN